MRNSENPEKVIMKPGTMLNPLPVVLVSCSDGERDNLITIAWTGIINSDPCAVLPELLRIR